MQLHAILDKLKVIKMSVLCACIISLFPMNIMNPHQLNDIFRWAMIPLMYPFSRLFSVPSTALVTLKSVNIFLGTVSTMSTFILEFLEADDEVCWFGGGGSNRSTDKRENVLELF